jgi:DAK2 domain fusion protein YloV
LSKRFINGKDLMDMVISGANMLQQHVQDVNALNVFPVPDGDTGSNMNLTMTSGVDLLKSKPSDHIGKAAEVFAKGLLMGARGNSGVILSQLMRGLSKSIAEFEQVDANQFAAALQQGVDTAYQAVVKPVEGTILTVSKEAAKHGVSAARRAGTVSELMNEVLYKAKEALARTPEQLPILKQVGVVDSGGQGLVYIYEGFLSALTGQTGESEIVKPILDAETEELEGWNAPHTVFNEKEVLQSKSAQSQIATEDIEFRYDMEFFIRLNRDSGFNVEHFRTQLAKDGDSILVIEDDGIVKVHVHSRRPGDVFNYALEYGELTKFNIENMRDQHRNILDDEDMEPALETAGDSVINPFGIIAVAMGDGIAEIFESLGVDVVISGGQTMNPSTEDIVNAIEAVKAEKIFILPNNSNIIMAANQSKEIVEDKEIVVIPTKTIPQGMAAVLAFQDHLDLDENADHMMEAVQRVRSGQVTFAVRNSSYEDLEIKENDFIGILDNKIVTTAPELLESSMHLLEQMIENGDEIVTILSGEDASEEVNVKLREHIESKFPDVEIEMHRGGQPLYYYIFAVE